ncbi:MAG: ABC transporter permease [Candidatus Eremiobacterota bacterium]
MRIVLAIASKEVQDATRNRWFWLYTGAFALLAAALSATALLGSGFGGLAGYGRTTASLINLVLLIVPLMGLTAGASSMAGERERGTLAYLMAQPVARFEVFWGKYLGQALGLGSSLVLGFGLSGMLVGLRGGREQSALYLTLLGLSLLLALASLGLGFLVATLVRRSSAAMGVVLVVWLALAFLGDLGLMGLTSGLHLKAPTLFHLSLANPLSVFRTASVLSLRSSLEAMGPAGLYAVRAYGPATMALLLGALAAWAALPATLSYAVFRRRSIL